MHREQPTDMPHRRGTPPRTRLLKAAERDAVRDLIDAVHALSDDPRPANVKRYLTASQALEDVRLGNSDPRAA